jgi:hypothetical protein
VIDNQVASPTRIARSACLLVTFTIAQSALAADRLVVSGCAYANGQNNPKVAFAVPSDAMTGAGSCPTSESVVCRAQIQCTSVIRTTDGSSDEHVKSRENMPLNATCSGSFVNGKPACPAQADECASSRTVEEFFGLHAPFFARGGYRPKTYDIGVSIVTQHRSFDLSVAKPKNEWDLTEIKVTGPDGSQTIRDWPKVIENRLFNCSHKVTHEFICHGDAITTAGNTEHPFCLANEGGCPSAESCLATWSGVKRENDGSTLSFTLNPMSPNTVTYLPVK